MGQKVNPKGFRVGVIKDWDSKWFADKKDFSDLLVEDYNIRKIVKKEVYDAGIADIEIERAVNNLKVTVFAGKPGMVIGKGGAGVEELKKKLEKAAPGKRIIINVEEIKYQDLSAQLVAENIASQLENRVAFRRAMKQSMQRTMRAGAKGIKTMVSGRLGGADMARSEGYSEGTIPLQTLRANIDYGFAEADTEYGKIGCKVWIYKGEVLPGEKAQREPKMKQPRNNRRRRNNRRPNNK
ncbi:30S ribosomal protein S3 [Anaerococcus prevotii]|uniref:Small ribosomal subunit protein uS3 n=1 Tax=Anaerococcus prevotii ACS-065-V-Col13 TaxID=879305 RepID=F0GV66_9FIRM|nr:30S ribosomal protein S3 [Anaerococcus prevotii]EGC82231.1 ribosomal protein S3 [Anaerococcus prevotii ACS-065-V-Col13]MDU5149040.1 30S ribosomal protein S3 [Anaerococcus prevotii]